MNLLLVLPILIPLVTAATSFLAWNDRRKQRWFGVAGAMALLVAGSILLATVWQNGIQAIQIGNWPAPFGITLVADLFSAVMVVLAGLIGLAVIVYSLVSVDVERETFNYYPLMHVLLLGVCGAFLTGDIFNLYVWFEVMLAASFMLLALGGERAQIEGAIKYVTINLLASALFLTAVGLLYGAAGTLNMADLAVKLRNVARPGLVTTLATVFLVVFGTKAAVFPLFFWLPASYHTPPVPVSAIFAGLLTKVGVYALIRVFTLLFVQDGDYSRTLILVLAGLTMVTGILGALAQEELRRVLSYQIIAQIGFAVMGLGLFTPLALAGAIFFIIEDVIALTNLFLISGLVHRLAGTFELPRLGGLYRTVPGVAILFLIPALSLSGMPPLSGFFAKLALVRAGLEVEQYVIVAIALGVSLLMLYLVARVWAEVFWKRAPVARPTETPAGGRAGIGTLLLPVAVLAALTVAIGLGAEPVFVLAMRAAEQLLNPVDYIQTVLP